MAAGATYTPIATTTLGSAQTSYTFSSIPSTYTDLVLVISVLGNGPQYARYRFNGDTGTNYSFTGVSGDGSSASSGRASSAAGLNLGLNNANAINILNVLNYSNTTTYKTCLATRRDASFGVDQYVGLWRSTAAINSIEFYSPNNFNAGTTLTLYGIASA